MFCYLFQNRKEEVGQELLATEEAEKSSPQWLLGDEKKKKCLWECVSVSNALFSEVRVEVTIE